MIDEVVVIVTEHNAADSVTGAVSAVKGQDMIKTKNENPQNMLTGRIPGLRVWQKSSEPELSITVSIFEVWDLH